MATDLIQCPKCGATPSAPPDGAGAYVCTYCATRFHLPQRAPAPAIAPALQRLIDVVERQGAVPRKVLRRRRIIALAVGVPLGVVIAAANIVRMRATEATRSSISPVVVVPGSGGAGESEPDTPATATFDFQSRHSSVGASFYALGFVTNTSSFAIGKPKVTAVLLDDSGHEVTTRFGYAEDEVVAPRAKTPIKILVDKPPAFASIRYEVVVKRASYVPTMADGLRVDVLEPPGKHDFAWKAAGKVKNGGGAPAKFVCIRLLAFDAADHVVGIDTTYADGDVLPAGGEARFSISPMYDAAPKRFELSVTGRAKN